MPQTPSTRLGPYEIRPVVRVCRTREIVCRMKPFTAAGTCFVMLTLCGSITAQVPVHFEPRHLVVFQDETLRVLDVNIEASDTTLDHIHINDIAIVCIAGCELRTKPLGGDWGDWISRTPGQVSVNVNVGQHSTHKHQAGGHQYHVVSVENLRQSGWSQDSPASGASVKLVSETRAFEIYDVRLDVGKAEAGHVHAHSVVAILVAGEVVFSGSGRRAAKALMWAVISAGNADRLENRGSAEAYIVELEVR